MQRRTFFVVLFSVILIQDISAQEIGWITSQELIKNASKLNGETVVFTGEAVGDLMRRGDFAWINVQDDYGTIGVWSPLELTKEITYLGDYTHKGDIIAVEGKFSRADTELGGELCVRAQNIRIVFPGFFIFHQLSSLKIKIAFILLVLLILLAGLKFFMFKVQKKIPSKKL